MAHDRDVAGIRCGGVLAALPDYLEGSLSDAERERVEAHLAGCDWCERFGGRYAGTVAALRRELGPAEPLDREAEARLRARVRGALG